MVWESPNNLQKCKHIVNGGGGLIFWVDVSQSPPHTSYSNTHTATCAHITQLQSGWRMEAARAHHQHAHEPLGLRCQGIHVMGVDAHEC